MKKVQFAKFLFVFLFCAVFVMGANAQNTFNKGDKVVNAGIGLGNTFGGYSSMIPISASFEMGIKDKLFDDKSSLGVGAYMGVGFTNGWTFLFPGVRGALHYQFVDKLDTYAGLMVGIRMYSGHGWSHTDLIVPFYIGGRYYFKKNLAGFAELGHGIAYLQVGVALKL